MKFQIEMVLFEISSFTIITATDQVQPLRNHLPSF